MSHGGGAVALGVVAEHRIGVDIERIRPVARHRQRLRRAFNAAEWSVIRSAASPDEELFRIWTRKEALLQAIGVGVTSRVRNARNDANEHAGVLELAPNPLLDPLGHSWLLWPLDELPGYIGTLAVSASAALASRPRVPIARDPKLMRHEKVRADHRVRDSGHPTVKATHTQRRWHGPR